MRKARLLFLAPACVAWLALATAATHAAAPANDNYLSSLRMVQADGTVPLDFSETVETAEATTQPDLFDPNREGIALGGAGPENTRCGAVEYGKTVWYDFAPEVYGGIEILASGYDSVVRVYEYDPLTSKITRTVACQNASSEPAERVILDEVARRKAYTVQVGGVGSGPAAASGRLGFGFSFFADQDRDDVLDAAPDRCPRQPGIDAAGGCPPELHPNVRYAYDDIPSGVRLTRLKVEQLPAGARVEARCRRCDVRQVRHVRGTSVTLTDFVDLALPAGARLEIFVTHPRTRSGRFLHGAIGSYLRYDVRADSLGRRTVRCLEPGSRVPRKRCT